MRVIIADLIMLAQYYMVGDLPPESLHRVLGKVEDILPYGERGRICGSADAGGELAAGELGLGVIPGIGGGRGK